MTGAELEERAEAAFAAGRSEESAALWSLAWRERLAEGAPEAAARCAHWLAFLAINRGDHSLAGGWAGRGLELLDRAGSTGPQRGYLLTVRGMLAFIGGDLPAAIQLMQTARDIADEHGDTDLAVLSRLGLGQLLIQQGQVAEGLDLLDTLMVDVMTGEVSMHVAGLAYCAVIGTCFSRFDIQRAQQWTAALTDWCDAQPDLVPYSGQCLVHRAELLQLHGDWPDARAAASAAQVRFELAADDHLTGLADYVRAEVDRLQGDLAAAEEGFRAAGLRGRDPQPGLALLRLAQGRIDDAAASLRRQVAESSDPARRPFVLAAHVEVMLAVGDVDAARVSCIELEQTARAAETPFVRAAADSCHGALALADGRPEEALGWLRSSVSGWLDLGAPYEAARARELIGRACQALGDEDSAALELAAAGTAYAELGAGIDLRRVAGPADGSGASSGARPVVGRPAGLPLTAREVEVLRLVATGATNRAIATRLVLSEKTVARHLSNIFGKLDVPSRAAATAYWYEHG